MPYLAKWILLQATRVVLALDGSGTLQSYMLISYDTTELKQNERSKLNRALFGGISTYLQRRVCGKRNITPAWLRNYMLNVLVREYFIDAQKRDHR